MKTYTLRPYQGVGRQFVTEHFRTMLHIEMSLGKTAIALHAIKDLLNSGKVYGALVVAPKMVADEVWQEEARSGHWPELMNLTFAKVLGNPQKRMGALHTQSHIKIINYENLLTAIPWMAHIWLKHGKALPFNMIVFDEVRMLQDIGTKRFRMLKKVIQLFPYRLGLTGTPAPQGLLDLFGSYLMVDDGYCLGKVANTYKRQYFRPTDYNQYRWEPKPEMSRVIYAKIAPITYSLRGDDYLILPKTVENDIYMDLPTKVQALYDTFEEKMLVRLVSGENLRAPTSAVVRVKCRQLANGAVYPDPDNHNLWENIHSVKLDMAELVFKAAEGSPMIIVYQFRHGRANLYKRLKKYGAVIAGAGVSSAKNKEILAAWNRGEVPGLITHSASLGHGLNLQFGGNQVMFYGLPESYGMYSQMIYRLKRPHQTSDRILVHKLLVRNTVDEVLRDSNTEKAKTQDMLWEAMMTYMVKKYGRKRLGMRDGNLRKV